MKSGKLLVVEVKAPGGEADCEAQALFLDRVRSAGGHAGVARSLDDALAIVEGRTVTARAPKLSLPRRRHDQGPALRAGKATIHQTPSRCNGHAIPGVHRGSHKTTGLITGMANARRGMGGNWRESLSLIYGGLPPALGNARSRSAARSPSRGLASAPGASSSSARTATTSSAPSRTCCAGTISRAGRLLFSWLLEHWLSWHPTLLAGRGGVGKSLLAQQLATALAIGRPLWEHLRQAGIGSLLGVRGRPRRDMAPAGPHLQGARHRI